MPISSDITEVESSCTRDDKCDKDSWRTPSVLGAELVKKYDCILDAAALENNSLCEEYFTKEDNALEQDWEKKKVFLNPPYSKLKAFLEKAHTEARKGAVVVTLLPVFSDTQYWLDAFDHCSEFYFIIGKLKFLSPKTGEAGDTAKFPSCVMVFRNDDVSKKIIGTMSRDGNVIKIFNE